MVVALVLTFSLGAWIAVAITTLAFLAVSFTSPGMAVPLLLRSPRFQLGLGVLVILLIALIAAGSLSGHLASAFTHVHGITAGRRIDVWQSSLRMIRDHPIFGVGPDNFLHYYAPTHQRFIPCRHGLGYMQPSAHDEPCLSHPHDEVLDLWLSVGLLGLFAFAWLQFVFWRVLWRKGAEILQTPVLLGAGAAMLAGLIHGLIDESYFLIDLSMLTWLFFAIASLSLTQRMFPLRNAVGTSRVG